MFRVGQKVVCVDDGPSYWGDAVPLLKNQVYTISGFRQPDYEGGDIGIYLVEVQVHEDEYYTDSFLPSRFRPVVDRPTDISIFTRMLTDADEKVEA